jgi:hypothetical protein
MHQKKEFTHRRLLSTKDKIQAGSLGPFAQVPERTSLLFVVLVYW